VMRRNRRSSHAAIQLLRCLLQPAPAGRAAWPPSAALQSPGSQRSAPKPSTQFGPAIRRAAMVHAPDCRLCSIQFRRLVLAASFSVLLSLRWR
jgi:hypothetical protein